MFDHLFDAAEEEEVKEAVLAHHLLRNSRELIAPVRTR